MEDWQEMIGFLGPNAGEKLRSTDWESSTNESGFSALPGGTCYNRSICSHYHYDGLETIACFARTENYGHEYVLMDPDISFKYDYYESRDGNYATRSLSVRCVKD